MLPLRGRLDAASKSNSSTLDPSRTTTRVSSGWLASISMRLDMGISGGAPSCPRSSARHWEGGPHIWGGRPAHAFRARLGRGDGKVERCVGHDVLKSGTADTAGKQAAIGG